ncbi:MAG TPA: hypothetical protein PKY59_21660 [Pyrinomonadaceae bacterium]|nr:hypothetical protein [Pyrinomonadaceae bacterium]
MKFSLTAVLSVLLLASAGWAQSAQNVTRGSRGVTANRGLQNRVGFTPFRKKPNKDQRKMLQPKAEDVAKYAKFLAQENVGIFRLLPDLGCQDNALVLKVDEVCMNEIPESSFYSFREDEHTSEWLADIRIKENNFITDGMLSQGFIVNLGDVELERTGVNSKGFKFINEYTPSDLSRDATRQSVEMLKGINVDGYTYRKILPAVENNTYALRVVAYRGNIIRSYRGFLFDLLSGDKRIDLTVAFRVIRKDTDGSLTLLWKEIQRKDAPKLKFPKKSKDKK